MQKRWRLYHNSGINSTIVEVAPWIKTRELIQSEILNLPPSIDRTRKRRKTLDATDRLLTRKELNEY